MSGSPDLPAEGDDPRDFAVCKSGVEDPLYSFEVGLFPLDQFSGETSSVAVVSEFEGKLVCAFPAIVWHRTVANRRLPTRALSKPGDSLDRSNPSSTGKELRLWFGVLDPRLEKYLDFSGSDQPDIPFQEEGDANLLPFAGALVEVAAEHFSFLTTESGGGGDGEEDGAEAKNAAQRLDALESTLASIQASLALLTHQQGSQVAAKPEVPAKQKASAAPGKGAKLDRSAAKPKAQGQVGALDDGVVQAALAAGVPMSHLEEMARIMTGKPNRLEDVPRQARKPDPLSDSDGGPEAEVVEPEDIEADPEEASGGSGVAKAIKQLTQIRSVLVEGKQRAAPSIEQQLPRRMQLRSKLCKEPSRTTSSICTKPWSQPGEPFGAGTTVRGWLASRSRVQNYTNHVRWVWQVGGIWDALIQGKHAEARARCGLLVAAANQASIDGGNWLTPGLRPSHAPFARPELNGNVSAGAKAGPPPDENHSQPEIRVPGSRASTFSGQGLLQAFLRHLLKSRSRLGSFESSTCKPAHRCVPDAPSVL